MSAAVASEIAYYDVEVKRHHQHHVVDRDVRVQARVILRVNRQVNPPWTTSQALCVLGYTVVIIVGY